MPNLLTTPQPTAPATVTANYTHATSHASFTESTSRSKAPPHPLLPPEAFAELSDSAWLRQKQLLRSNKNPVGLLPFSGPTLWRKVAAGSFPKPKKLSARVTAWQVGEVRAWLAAQAAA